MDIAIIELLLILAIIFCCCLVNILLPLETCQYIAKDCRAQLFFCENETQVNKLLEVKRKREREREGEGRG